MIEKLLKNKLKSAGYLNDKIEKNISDVDFSILTTKENFSEKDIEIIEYNTPNVDIERVFLNTDSKYIQMKLIDGDIELKTTVTPTGNRLTIADYKMDSVLCILLITSELTIEVVIYNPDENTMHKYNARKYDEIYSSDREEIAKEYINALTANNRLMLSKAREVVDVLTNDFVIDELIIENINPVLKLYDKPESFAEKITSYEFKYINRRLNRIEIAEKPVLLKRVSKDVVVGHLTNDPYVKLKDVNNYADFKLNTVSYFWMFEDERGRQEIGIYTALTNEARLYSETVENEDFGRVATGIANQFFNQVGFPVNDKAIEDVLKRLNHQLVVPPTNLILKYAQNPEDPIEPLGYKYKAITDSADFETRLYNSIEDNLGRRYKYKLTENVLEDLTTIGNKLDYTDENGRQVKKQSIADFNQNSNAVVIRRETLIDASNIPELLGYIYDDIENVGTDNLPVPSIEIDFYFPNPSSTSEGIRMYNGTNYENVSDAILNGNRFYAIDEVQNVLYNERSAVEGSTRVVVRYMAKNGDVLKENVIKNVFPGSTYVPEILPVIADKEGKEWICKLTTLPNLVLSDNFENNKIELEYTEKMTKAKLQFVNRENKKLSEDKIIDVQVGTEIAKNDYSTIIDSEGTEWNILYSSPEKITVGENEKQNTITFVYDVTRVEVIINYINKKRDVLKKSAVVKAVADKRYSANIEPIIEDEGGKAWVYISDSAASIIPKEKEENIINLVYDEMKTKVVTAFVDEEGNKVKDDVVEFIQVGKQHNIVYQEELRDFEGKLWKMKNVSASIIKVSQDLNENEAKVVYAPVYGKVTVKFTDENANTLKDDIEEKIQVGTLYESSRIENIKDVKGKFWICDTKKSITISENEKDNIIQLIFKPLIQKVTIVYLNDESEEIIAASTDLAQAGENYTVKMPESLEDSKGKRWILSKTNSSSYIVSENESKNKISLYYDKDLTDVKLTFRDITSNILREDVTIKWQIGAQYENLAYEKIKSDNGERWSWVSSEPKNMVVKERNNHFTLIYDEIRTKVIIKYLNIENNELIAPPEILTAKLGTTYIPNILTNMVDSNRLVWNYIGEKDISITTQEEEQNNIIVLKYEPKKSKVSVKYLNDRNESIADDNIKEMQIGLEVQIKKIEKIYSSDKLGWKLNKCTKDVIRVAENQNENIVTCSYIPYTNDVVVEYKAEDGKEIIKPLVKQLQVGKKFIAEVIDKVVDSDGKHWNYAGDTTNEITVSEENNNIVLKYVPLLKDARIKYIDVDGNEILPTSKNPIQVGAIFIPKIEAEAVDIEGKVWEHVSASKDEIVIKEDELQNEIIMKYKKKIVDIIISFVNVENKVLKSDEKLSAQVGSIFRYAPDNTIVDKDGLGWLLEENEREFNIQNENNKFVVNYVPHLVNVYDRFINSKEEEIIAAVVTQKQVGTKYEATIQNSIVDSEGKEWTYVENKLFGKTNSIKVSNDENKNSVNIKYEPASAEVTIKYVDALGEALKAKTVVKAQIGSEFSADVIEKITDAKGNKWTYNPNSKNLIKVEKENNVITLSYEEQKALVTYKYQDEYGNRLKAPTKKLVQIGTTYVPEADPIIEDEQGKTWEYKSRSCDSIEIKDSEQDNIVVLVYEPMKIEVVLFIKDKLGNEIMSPIIQKAQLGNEYRPNIDATLTDENSLMYKFNKIVPESLIIKETPIGAKENLNSFVLTYEEVYSTVTIKYQDFDGNMLREDENIQLQVGTKYTPKKLQFIKDRKENQWELMNDEDATIRVMENPKENVIKFRYEVAKADIVVKYKNVEGSSIKDDEHFNIQIGKEFIPEIPKFLFDKQNRKWSFFNAEPVKLKVGSINNVITIMYQEEKVAVVIKFRDGNNKQLKADERIMAQIGTTFRPNITTKVIYDENEIWRFSCLEPKEIIVSENTNENIISQIYTNGDVEETVHVEESRINDIPKDNEIDMGLLNNDNAIVIKTANESETQDIVENVEEKVTDEKLEVQEEGYVYKNEKLKKLDAVTPLNDTEKATFEEINLLNIEIQKILENGNEISKIAEFFEREKELVRNNLKDLIADDKTGSKILKLFEIALEVPLEDENLRTLQQRKAVIMTDYFLNNALTDIEQAVYICAKGKNANQLSIVENSNPNSELHKQLTYEKLLLENYYRARSVVKDNYFTDESSKEQLPAEVVVAVSNMLVNQTYKLFVKNDRDAGEETELQALYAMLNQMQKDKLVQLVNKISDNKQRKALLKKLQTMN
mgnify:CR=1 FL=1